MTEGERTTVSPVTAEDAAALHHYYARNAAHLAPWTPLRPPGHHDLDAWAKRAARYKEEGRAGAAFHHAVRLAGFPGIAGVCSFTDVVRGPFQACHLGFSIDRALEGRGVMREALGAVIPTMFAEHGLHRIMAGYMPRNRRSGALLERLGFEHEGHAREYLKIAGRWEDHVLTSRIGS